MSVRLIPGPRTIFRLLAAAALCAVTAQASAGMFDDEEARRAILELRQKVDILRKETDQRITDESKRQADEIAGLRRSLLDLQNQLDASAADAARMRGQNEQLTRDLADAQRRQTDASKALDERLRKFEPSKVSYEGAEFWVEPQERRAFEQALTSFRKGDFEPSRVALVDFLARYPQTGYTNAALFWLGNAQFVGKDYKGAMASFQKLLALDAKYSRVPEALLAIANCQLELKDSALARKTLESLIADYPRSEAADAAKDRLARLK